MAEEQVAWTATPYRAEVLDASGGVIGRTESLLGDEAEDIFHGLAVKRKSDGRMVEIEASQVARITTQRVYTTISSAEGSSLPDYKAERWYHIGWGGLFRKHPEWDATSGT
jgi:hypothetical protein